MKIWDESANAYYEGKPLTDEMIIIMLKNMLKDPMLSEDELKQALSDERKKPDALRDDRLIQVLEDCLYF